MLITKIIVTLALVFGLSLMAYATYKSNFESIVMFSAGGFLAVLASVGAFIGWWLS